MKIYKSKTVELTDELGVYLPVAEDFYEGRAAMQALGFKIFGNVGEPGATVTWAAEDMSQSGTTTADGSGNYTISGLLGSGRTYDLSVALAGFTFLPPLQSVVVGTADVHGINFAVSTVPSGGYGMSVPILLQPGHNGYFFGSYDPSKPNPRFAITRTAGDGATATINVKQLEGFTPAVGDLITVTGTTQASGAFNVSNVALSAVSLDPVTGIGTLQYASTGNVAAGPDPGQAVVINGEVPEVLANGTSRAVALQTIAGENANGKTIAWASTFPTAPIAVTLSLQGALFDNDGDYQTIASTNNIAGDNLIIVDILQRFFRVVASGVSGGATVISKITI